MLRIINKEQRSFTFFFFFLWLSVNRLNYAVLLSFFEADVCHWTIFLCAMTKRVSQH